MGINIKSVLTAGFPFLATALSAGGPVGSLAANAIGTALGVNKPKLEEVDDVLTAALAKDPAQAEKLKEAEEQFKLQMQKLGYDDVEKLAQLASEDRASARAREIAVKDKTPRNIAYVVVFLTILLEGIVLFHGVSSTSPMIVGRVLGTLDSATMLVLSYYFGSSSSSDKKNDIISDAINSQKED